MADTTHEAVAKCMREFAKSMAPSSRKGLYDLAEAVQLLGKQATERVQAVDVANVLIHLPWLCKRVGAEPPPDDNMTWAIAVENITKEMRRRAELGYGAAMHASEGIIEELSSKLVAADMRANRAEKEMEATKRELRRLIHGEEIESDGICDHEFELQHFRDRVREALLRYDEKPGVLSRIAGDVGSSSEAKMADDATQDDLDLSAFFRPKDEVIRTWLALECWVRLMDEADQRAVANG